MLRTDDAGMRRKKKWQSMASQSNTFRTCIQVYRNKKIINLPSKSCTYCTDVYHIFVYHLQSGDTEIRLVMVKKNYSKNESLYIHGGPTIRLDLPKKL